eukprot:876232-Heterocapsa_arctica.AAC.1
MPPTIAFAIHSALSRSRHSHSKHNSSSIFMQLAFRPLPSFRAPASTSIADQDLAQARDVGFRPQSPPSLSKTFTCRRRPRSRPARRPPSS